MSDKVIIICFLEYLTVGEQEIYFLSASRPELVIIGPAKKILKIYQKMRFLWPKRILNRNLALTRETIHDNEFSFYAILLTLTLYIKI